MKIAIGSDHAGFPLKQEILNHFKFKEVAFKDVGCYSDERVDYVDYAVLAMKSILSGECDRAILVCGTGIGMSMAANKFKGIRAALCMNINMSKMSRKHNNSNCLTLGGRILSRKKALRIVDIWLETEFEGGRHCLRLDKIRELENKNFKS